MQLSAPIFQLKKQARALVRQEKIPLHDALDRIARQEGFETWSLLSARFKFTPTTAQIFNRFRPGDLVLLAARPFQGKTTMGLALIAEASRARRHAAFFTLYLTEPDLHARLKALDVDVSDHQDSLLLDTSDEICAPYIVERMQYAPSGMLIIIDYLQILDQRRDTPSLAEQVTLLKGFAQTSGAIIILISQVNRHYEASSKDIPDLSDVYLPNPIDFGAFTKTCFLNNGNLKIEAVA